MNFTAVSSQPEPEPEQEQPPENCGRVLRIGISGLDLLITPGILNCFVCPFRFRVFSWQIEMGEANTSESGTYLLLDMPESYVQPGLSGRRNITCISDSAPPDMPFQARLVSPGKSLKTISAVTGRNNPITF